MSLDKFRMTERKVADFQRKQTLLLGTVDAGGGVDGVV